jgi:glutamate/tyrosine decarboxylase-like PLP-dependent enzyme
MKTCQPKDISLKALFLGPQGENAEWFFSAGKNIFTRWFDWRGGQFPHDGISISAQDRSHPEYAARQTLIESRLEELLSRLNGECPKFSPRYLGHMTSEIALPALLGHIAVLFHNPNQTSREVSKVTTEIEREAVMGLLGMVGFDPESGRGHFTSGGTLANLESLWRFQYRLDRSLAVTLALLSRGETVSGPPALCRGWEWIETQMARFGIEEPALDRFSLLRLGETEFSRLFLEIAGEEYRPPLILAPASRHFSWPKAVALLGIGSKQLHGIALDESGRMSVPSLREKLSAARESRRSVGMLVSVAGTTELGAVDPIHLIQNELDEHRRACGEEIWHHIDAAYGGYFCSLLRGAKPSSPLLKEETASALGAIESAHSVTIDPHKLGFVPYACGAILARDARHYRSPAFSAPYLLDDNQGSWMYTIEGSRAGTGAAATWMSGHAIGLDSDGYGRLLERGLLAREIVLSALREMEGEVSVPSLPETNIVCFSLARRKESLSGANRRTLECFRMFQESPDCSVSKTVLSLADHRAIISKVVAEKEMEADDDHLLCLRLVLMNPFLLSKESKTSAVDELVRLMRAHLGIQ